MGYRGDDMTNNYAMSICTVFIKQVFKNHASNGGNVYTFCKERVQIQSRLQDGSHLHTYEAHINNPYIQQLIGMNYKLTCFGFPFVMYGDCIKIYLFDGWYKKPVWFTNDEDVCVIRNITIDRQIVQTGLMFLTVEKATGLHNAK